MGGTHEETAKEEFDLLRGHEGCATPIRPTRSMRLVVVDPRIEIDRGMDEAENETLGSPVDDDIYSQIVIVADDFLCIWPGGGGAGVAKTATHFGETQKTDTEKSRRAKIEKKGTTYLVTEPWRVREWSTPLRSDSAEDCSSG